MKIGLIAGGLRLPLIWARAAWQQGHRVTGLILDTEAEEFEPYCEALYSLPAGELDRVINTLHQEGITQVVMMGKVAKERALDHSQFDARFLALLQGLDDLTTDHLMLAVVEELKSEGIEVLKQTTFLEDLLPAPGQLTARGPDEKTGRELEFGLRMSRAIGELDIGQTVVIKDRFVVAAEAVEGTDATIARAGRLAAETVVVKAAKPKQDFRFDVPLVGLETLEVMCQNKVKALGLEAGRCLILEKREFIRRAEEAGIVVSALEGE